MGGCISTPAGASCSKSEGEKPVRNQPAAGKKDRSADYFDEDDDQNKAIIEGLAGAYQVVKLLGSGAEGNTWLVQDAKDDKLWAIKLIKLPLPTRFVQAIFREIKLQSELGEGHTNIVTPEEVVLTNHYLGLVMEYAPGGSMTSFITQRFRQCRGVGLLMSEEEARYFFKQIVSAVDYCHRHHVAHRDLKLDNTLLNSDNPPLIKVCDFGFARGWGEDSHFTTVIGTPDYMSPQITAAKAQGKTTYDGVKADVWAMGVLLCVMLIGKFPFEGDSVSAMGVQDPMKKIWLQQNKALWNENHLLKEQLQYLSLEAVDLLDKMFELTETKRIDLRSIKGHPWMQVPMSPKYQSVIDKLERDQYNTEKLVAAGGYRSKQRDAAISNLIKLAASDEFRKRATDPITNDTVFQIWSRISLRTALNQYPVFDKRSLRQMMSYTGGGTEAIKQIKKSTQSYRGG